MAAKFDKAAPQFLRRDYLGLEAAWRPKLEVYTPI
jgi:hypothetical protein